MDRTRQLPVEIEMKQSIDREKNCEKEDKRDKSPHEVKAPLSPSLSPLAKIFPQERAQWG